jgi:hypothetical protein
LHGGKLMNGRIRSQFARTAFYCGLTLAAGLVLHSTANSHDNRYASDPAPYPPEVEMRTGGILERSYRYHRHGADTAYAATPNIAPPGGWYGYGFPGQTHRWGWFGAQRYYPRVMWHRGYYGDCSRWGYRHGY